MKVNAAITSKLVPSTPSTQLDKKILDALVNLGNLDTTKDYTQFLNDFQNLKNSSAIINQLCQSPQSMLTGDENSLAQASTKILAQLKHGSNLDNYFQLNQATPPALCQKIASVLNHLHTQTYSVEEQLRYTQDKLYFAELSTFNANLGFSPPSYSAEQQTPWQGFCRANPAYLALTAENQMQTQRINLAGKSCNLLRQEVCQQLGCPTTLKIFNSDTSLNEQLCQQIQQQQLQQHAATKIQSLVKGHQARKPVDEYSNFYPIKDSQQHVIGWRDQELHKVLADPTLLATANQDESGTSKQLTHRGHGTVGFTPIKKIAQHKLKTPSELAKESKKSVTQIIEVPQGVTQKTKRALTYTSEVSKGIIKEIFRLGIKTIVPQYRVKENLFVAPDLATDLVNAINNEIPLPSIKEFKALILDIEILHNHNIIHRDIKPENIMLKEGKVYLSDLDTMIRLDNGSIKYGGTLDYCPKELLLNPKLYGKNIDKICMLTTLICVFYATTPNHINLLQKAQYIRDFVKPEYQTMVRKFLYNPVLPLPRLSEVLKF